MPALRTEIGQDDWSLGMVRDVAPGLIPMTGAYDIVDALLDEDGNPYKRGGTAYKSKEGMGEGGLSWLTDVYLRPGQRTVFANANDFGVLGSDDESIANLGGAGLTLPKQSAVLQEVLYIGGGFLYGGSRKSAVYETGKVSVTKGSAVVTGTGTTWNTLVDAGMLFHFGSERVYVVASVDSTTQITLTEAYEGASGGEKSYTLSPLWTVGGSDPYEAYDFVTVCANRFVFLKGRTVTFTEVYKPHSTTNVHGTTNEHTLPEGVEGLGLTTVGQTVLIFTTRGIWVLDGLAVDIVDQNGNPQHRLQQLSSDFVLAGAPGIAGAGQQMVVPASDGIYLMDGISQPARISRPLERLYRQKIASGLRPGKAAVFRSHYLLPLVTATGDVRALYVCRLDRPNRFRGQAAFPWSRFSGDGGEIPAFAVRSGTGPTEPKLLGVQARKPSRVVDCTSYFDPDSEHETDADGTHADLDIIGPDYETGSGTINAVRALKPRYELFGAGDPKIKAFISTGVNKAGGPKFGEAKFGEAKFGGEGVATFVQVGEAGESDARDPARFRVNKRMRNARVRIKSYGPAATCSLRSVELTIRPSGAVRR